MENYEPNPTAAVGLVMMAIYWFLLGLGVGWFIWG